MLGCEVWIDEKQKTHDREGKIRFVSRPYDRNLEETRYDDRVANHNTQNNGKDANKIVAFPKTRCPQNCFAKSRSYQIIKKIE